MKKIILSGLILFLIGTAYADNNEKTNAFIKEQLMDPEIPALVCVVIKNNTTVYSYAEGLRQLPQRQAVTIEDKFHIGSNTKAMTALLAATAVDKGEIEWSSTVKKVLGRVFDNIPSAYAGITLEQLLSHTAGITNDINSVSWNNYFFYKSLYSDQRIKMTNEIFNIPLLFEPGSSWAYSNFGYVIAGAMLEAACGKSWEILITERIFAPLQMYSGSFGPPAQRVENKSSQPWGHNPASVDPQTPGADNPLVLGPAGTVHANAGDLARYLLLFCNEGKYPPEKPLISTQTWKKLVTPVHNQYALGRFAYNDSSLGSLVLTHDGSNTMFYSSFNVYPDIDAAILVLCNSGTAAAAETVTKLKNYLAGQYIR